MLGVLTHSQRRLKTPQFCSIFFDLSKSHQSRATTGLKRHFQSASYPLSINTRNAHESSSKIACFLFDFLRAKTTTTKAFSRQNTHRLFHRFCEQQKPSCRWLASLRDTNHLLQCFSVPSSITKSEPTPKARDPTIFCLTNSGTVSSTRNFSRAAKRWQGVGAQP